MLSFPIVGIGTSAGGLEVLKEFFTAMPAESGMAFVVIPTLGPGIGMDETFKTESLILFYHQRARQRNRSGAGLRNYEKP